MHLQNQIIKGTSNDNDLYNISVTKHSFWPDMARIWPGTTSWAFRFETLNVPRKGDLTRLHANV